MEIKEPLAITGGSLIATPKNWKLQFAFPGPDRRYQYTIVNLSSDDVGRLLDTYPAAFERYLRLKRELPSSTKANEAVGSHLTIRVNDFADGVCLAGYRSRVTTETELDHHLGILRDAQLRGVKLMRAAADLSR